jgi:flagellar basal body rod protein FlgB
MLLIQKSSKNNNTIHLSYSNLKFSKNQIPYHANPTFKLLVINMFDSIVNVLNSL